MCRIRPSLFFGILVFSLLACDKSSKNPIQFHHDYFPLETGRYVSYEAMEISHDEQGLITSDTNNFYLKTVIGDSILDNSGHINYEFLRYKKDSLHHDWVLQDVWTVRVIENRLEVVEENVRLVKFAFPPKKSKIWDMNAYNTKPEMLTRFNPELLHDAYQLGTFALDSAVQVDEQDFFSLVDHRRKYEVYAKNIGLVYKFYKDNAIDNFDTLDIRLGKEIHYRMIDFGLE
jgi:hypothetical protein